MTDLTLRPAASFWKRYGFGYLLILPTVLYLVLFQVYPLFESFRLSFTDLNFLRPGSGGYIGLQNYLKLMTQDPNFWPIFGNSLFWVLGSTVLQFIVAMPAALVLNAKLPFRPVWRGLLMVPWVTPMVVMGLIWKWIYDGDYGLLNFYLHTKVIWLGDQGTVWPALLFASMWKGFPYVTLMMLAGLQGVPEEMYEASYIDGCNAWKRFFYITLPMLVPVMFVTGLVCIITSWTKFEMIWVLTAGGPGHATSILPTYIYTNSFQFFNLGTGSAVAAISTLFVLAIVLVYLRLFDAKGNE
ncbi:carbohydrate ABC transporter membrane protein 1 (CUT1 family) [Hydrogenispora ethanolica]|uniref:Carbohydrate ABC transporter membrane protein 1 (CUT1 family) n=1 Tax=Hydrogenispora ethanolica TaxID=1082276 RepID=A0A4R1S6S4_HYDET|nr:sugar ABC transporter permease [Hydrogenispora ethanolica]TCL74152.1 carbohydrate ABC transporter membrane protein 1 (CUT1 family) [Hydrogenispora ethanolica]